ncbi:MAG: M13 family metallopeptidase [Pseudomonadota bacterium]
MKRYSISHLLACAASLSVLTSCSNGDETTSAQASKSDIDITTIKPAGPELGSFGIVLDDRDLDISPGDNFFQYVNGRWVDTFEIPDEFSSYSAFTVLFERSEERVKSIIENASADNAKPGSSAEKIAHFYSSFLDTDTIEKLGLSPISKDLDRIESANSHDAIASLMIDPAMPAHTPYGIYVDIDSKQTDRYILYLTQSGLGMPNKTYYQDAKFSDKKVTYRDYIVKVFSLVGRNTPQTRADRVIELESSIANAHWTPEKRRNRDLTYNLKTLEELQEFAPGFPWAMAFAKIGLEAQGEFVLREDDALQKLSALFTVTDIDVWKDYLTFHLINSAADVLPLAFDQAKFEFYGTQLRGTPKQKERWKRGVAAVNASLGEAVGQIYVDRYFPASSKENMQTLVENLKRSMKQRLSAINWMGEETKQEAFKKLEKFTTKIGYPDKWKDYSALNPVSGEAYENFKRINIWKWNNEISKLGGPIDDTEWFMTPQTVNAYYSPNRNEIVFPAAILQAPFFDPAADLAVNYGAIGAVIGHEIGHGFDDQGRKSDGDGTLRDWWTTDDTTNFKKLADALSAQFGEYEPIPGFKIRPGLTLGENIGDLGGLAMAYYAYQLALDGKPAPVIDGLTGDQRFFLAWGQVWKRATREEALKNQIETDPHSPAEFRVNGIVRNMDAWYTAFNVQPDDELYLAPEDRVQIW